MRAISQSITSLRLSTEMLESLRERARLDEASMGEVMRQAIAEHLQGVEAEGEAEQ